MAYVRLGTTTTQSIVEFLIFDDNDKQCATVYYSTSTKSEKYYNSIKSAIIGKIPETIKDDLKKLEKIAETALQKN